MDIQKLLRASKSSTSSEEGGGGVRDKGYKRRSVAMESTGKAKALRVIKTEENRKLQREQKAQQNRNIQEEDENQENQPAPIQGKEKAVKPKNDRKEQLALWREEKKKVAARERKAKPVWQPGGSSKGKEIGATSPFGNSTLNTTRNTAGGSLMKNSRGGSSANLSRAVSRTNLASSRMNLAGSRMNLAGSMANLATGTRTRMASGRGKVAEVIKESALTTRSSGRTRKAPEVLAGPGGSTRNRKKVPAISVSPPPMTKSSTSSSESGGSASSAQSSKSQVASFAPAEFQFTLALPVTAATTQAVPTSSTPTKVCALQLSGRPPIISEVLPHVPEEAAVLEDDVFNEADEENLDDTEKEVEGDSVKETTEDSEDSIDEEIARSVRKNRKAKKVEKVIFPYLVDESADSQNEVSCQQEGVKEVQEGSKEVQEGSKEKEVDVKEKEVDVKEKEVEGSVVATPRRSRRMSGVQPDPSLTQEQLAVTPARRVKERSVSGDRRRQPSCCLKGCCNTGEHSAPATPRVSRIPILAAVTESSPGLQEEQKTTRRSSRLVVEPVRRSPSPRRRSPSPARRSRSTRRSSSSSTQPQEEPEQQQLPAPRVATRRRSAKPIIPSTGSSTDGTPHHKPSRLPVVTPANKAAVTMEATEGAVTPATDLANIFSTASLQSAAKPPVSSTPPPRQPTFKTPAKTVRSAAKVRGEDSMTVSSPLASVSSARGRSNKRKPQRLSQSEGKTGRNASLSSIFDDMENSPILAKLEKKFKSAEAFTEEDFMEPQEKVAKLSANWCSKVAREEEEEEEAKELAKEVSEVAREVAEEVIEPAAVEQEISGGVEHGSVPYFRALLVTEGQRLTKLCDEWEVKLEKNKEKINEDIQGTIQSVIGQGRLFMNPKGRFTMFTGLVDNCEFGTGERETTTSDLMGFWEMIYFQVEDVDAKFSALSKVEAAGWQEEEVKKTVVVKKKTLPAGAGRVKPKAGGATSGLRAMIAAKRKKAEEEKLVKVVIQPASPLEDVVTGEGEGEAARTFEGGFFSVTSPSRTSPSVSPLRSPASAPTSKSTGGDRLRRSVLTDSARRVSGLISPFVSAMSKRGAGREKSPVEKKQLTRRSGLFDDMDTVETPSPRPSPGRTYSRQSGSPRQEAGRKEEAFDRLLVEQEAMDTAGPESEDKLSEVEVEGRPRTPENCAEVGERGVRFTPGQQDPAMSQAVLGTPHPKSGRKLSKDDEEEDKENGQEERSKGQVESKVQEIESKVQETSQGLRRSRGRVSLMPMVEEAAPLAKAQESVTQDLMSFGSPTPDTPTRRSRRSVVPTSK